MVKLVLEKSDGQLLAQVLAVHVAFLWESPPDLDMSDVCPGQNAAEVSSRLIAIMRRIRLGLDGDCPILAAPPTPDKGS